MLANAELKGKYIYYLMDYFVKATKNSPTHNIQLIFDHEHISCPCLVSAGNILDLPMLKNKNGEADYNVWFHCIMSTSDKIVVFREYMGVWNDIFGVWLVKEQRCVCRMERSMYT